MDLRLGQLSPMHYQLARMKDVKEGIEKIMDGYLLSEHRRQLGIAGFMKSVEFFNQGMFGIDIKI